MLFFHCFLFLSLLIVLDVDSLHFGIFLTTCETSSIEIRFVLATGLAENLTQMIFRQPFVIQQC